MASFGVQQQSRRKQGGGRAQARRPFERQGQTNASEFVEDSFGGADYYPFEATIDPSVSITYPDYPPPMCDETGNCMPPEFDFGNGNQTFPFPPPPPPPPQFHMFGRHNGSGQFPHFPPPRPFGGRQGMGQQNGGPYFGGQEFGSVQGQGQPNEPFGGPGQFFRGRPFAGQGPFGGVQGFGGGQNQGQNVGPNQGFGPFAGRRPFGGQGQGFNGQGQFGGQSGFGFQGRGPQNQGQPAQGSFSGFGRTTPPAFTDVGTQPNNQPFPEIQLQQPVETVAVAQNQ